MEFITSSKGGIKLCHDSFMYKKKAEKSNRIRWECSQRQGLLCKGAVTTSLQRDDLHVTVPHCHAADADAVEAEKVKLKMRTHVRDIRTRPGQVLAAGMASSTVICDFEQAAMNSVTSTLGQHVTVQGCFYHLSQSTW